MEKMPLSFIGSRMLFTSIALTFRTAQALNTCIPPTPLNASHKTNFVTCLSTIQNMTLDQRTESGCFQSPADGILTLEGRRLMCGRAIEFWDWKDTLDRLSLLIIPAAILISHVAFPPLGWHNYRFFQPALRLPLWWQLLLPLLFGPSNKSMKTIHVLTSKTPIPSQWSAFCSSPSLRCGSVLDLVHSQPDQAPFAS
jgi:hypothetical protein